MRSETATASSIESATSVSVARTSSGRPTEMQITAESGPCSCCASRSACTRTGSALSSAMTTSSVGPAVRSMPTSPTTRALAAVTYEFPGPAILSTRGRVSVPRARAAMPAAPPAR